MFFYRAWTVRSGPERATSGPQTLLVSSRLIRGHERRQPRAVRVGRLRIQVEDVVVPWVVEREEAAAEPASVPGRAGDEVGEARGCALAGRGILEEEE